MDKKVYSKSNSNKNIDLILINVEYRWDQMFPDPNLGLLSLATIAQEKDYNTIYYDTQVDQFSTKTFIEDLIDLEPYVVGLSCNSDNIFEVKRLISIIRNTIPRTKIILGGPHVSAMPEKVLSETNADVIVRGEGEMTLLDLMAHFIKNEKTLADIPGIFYFENDRTVQTPPRTFISDLDILPIPDRNMLVDPQQYSGNLISGRGCPYHCAFCFEGTTGNTYRALSAERTMNEIALLVDEFKYPYFSFADDTFIANRRRAREVCEMIIDRYGEYPPFGWYCEGRVDILSGHPELLQLMKRAGLVRIQIGVESGDQEILDLYDKKITLEQIEQVVSACVKADIVSIFANFIIGGPFETEARVERSIDFARHLCDLAPGRMECYSTYLSPFPGTGIYENPAKFGLRPVDQDLETGESMTYPFYETNELDKWQVMNLKSRFDSSISRKMEALVETVPKSLIDQHVEAYKKGMKSLWLPFFTSRRGIDRYYRTTHSDLFCGFYDIDRKEILDWCPIRIVAPLLSENQRTVLVSGKSTIRLNEEGSEIYELSSGRFTTRQVIDRLYEKNSSVLPSYDVFTDQVLDFYATMDEEFAVLFKEV